jgi:predicted O-linked N-acetylglucosamine transferase (SPINDLY family)
MRDLESRVLALFQQGNALYELQRYAEAVASYEAAIALQPDLAGGYFNRGMALHGMGRYEAAIASFDKAIELKPDYARAYNHRGNALQESGRLGPALASFAAAISIRADYADAHNNQGNASFLLGEHRAALAAYERVIALQPDFADAHNNRGNALFELGEVQAALASYERALALQPQYAGVHFNRGQMQDALGQHEAAALSYDRVLALQPDFKFALGHRLHARMQICDWTGYDADLARLLARIELDQAAASPFTVLTVSASAALQKKAAELWVREKAPADDGLGAIPRRGNTGKIRIGYFSADFCNHPVAALTAELYELHDRSRFEVIAFSFGLNTQDAMRQRLERVFDEFIDVHGQSASDMAALARQRQIDIAIDLGGFTRGSRPAIFAMRAAPIQVSYLGYLGTMGAPYMDYLIADATLVPFAARAHYTEKIAFLPSYQANDSKRLVSDRHFSRHELGLPPAAFVFCCFNASYKITPVTFDSWMRILGAAPGAVLFLYAASVVAESNLKRRALDRGIDAGRLVFGGRLPPPDHLARCRVADLFLDTWPYNAGTTASDALWVGLPVMTCMQGAFAGRMAASLLHAIGLPELVTYDSRQYEELAVALATSPQRMAMIKERLAENRLTTRLFDTPLHTRSLETAFALMHERLNAGLPSEDITIS